MLNKSKDGEREDGEGAAAEKEERETRRSSTIASRETVTRNAVSDADLANLPLDLPNRASVSADVTGKSLSSARRPNFRALTRSIRQRSQTKSSLDSLKERRKTLLHRLATAQHHSITNRGMLDANLTPT